MAEFLCFTLAAPIASFGEAAGNLSRGTLDRPGHSLIVGLIGAALGLERDDPRLPAMSDGLRIAVEMDAAGAHLRDYHTVQTAEARRGFQPATRRQALLEGVLGTIITERDYLTDVRVFVAVAREDGPFALDEMAQALRAPRFTLYLGRKSCPLALPAWPHLQRAASADAALRDYAEKHGVDARELFPVRRCAPTLAADSRLYPSAAPGRRMRRRTGVEDRGAWRYRLLEELVLDVPSPKKDGEATP